VRRADGAKTEDVKREFGQIERKGRSMQEGVPNNEGIVIVIVAGIDIGIWDS
jgi:hypothetical protein